MAHYNLTRNPADERRFAALAYAQGWSLALHTPAAARPSPLDERWRDDVRSVALVVWLAQPDADAGGELVDDRDAGRRTFEDAFVRGFGDCLQVLCCWHCGAPRVPEVGRHFCSPDCRAAWCAVHDRTEWAELVVCSTCQGALDHPDQRFCSALCEAEATATRVWR